MLSKTLATACLILLPALPQHALAKGGLLSGAVGSAIRHSGGGDSGVKAEEGMISAADPEGMVAVMQDLGYRATLDVDSGGDPMISSSTGGVKFDILFYGCVDNTGCDSILYLSGFDLTEGMKAEEVNDWNRRAVTAMAYLDDENDPYLQSYVLTRSGIPEEVFSYTLKEWDQAIGEFRDEIDF
ncbi:YbjN domain-containing protein [Pseudooceanicola sp. HF7]|uniref:YbjN domain-containing protein n=1 Tax=Pseudooceanicola sp. HF7 TaxID=2721560 RepID=UPI0014309898|nr:YbjN domain-containing protein [Pseudooceanicola sp. HF7]NIZ10265.1 YbjN domain-containing protein [Pseudooceanicola sp. HF7]